MYVILSGVLSRASRIEVSVVQLLGSSEPAQRMFAIACTEGVCNSSQNHHFE